MIKILSLNILFIAFLIPSSFANDIGSGKFSSANVVIPVTNIDIDGSSATMTIPKNARSLKNKAKNSTIFALEQKKGTPETNCPKILSSNIDRRTLNYNMFSGKARIAVDFQDNDTAKAALASNCLLIENG